MSSGVPMDFQTQRRVRDPVFQDIQTAIGVDKMKKETDREAEKLGGFFNGVLFKSWLFLTQFIKSFIRSQQDQRDAVLHYKFRSGNQA